MRTEGGSDNLVHLTRVGNALFVWFVSVFISLMLTKYIYGHHHIPHPTYNKTLQMVGPARLIPADQRESINAYMQYRCLYANRLTGL